MTENAFEERLSAYLVAAEARPLSAGVELRVIQRLAERAAVTRRASSRRLPALTGHRFQAAVAAALAIALVAGGYGYWRHTASRSALDHARLVVAIQPAGAGLDCSLPISALSADRTTGFVHLRGGSSTFEPVRTDALVYVTALRQWARTYPQLIAPDGRSYVRREIGPGQNAIHVVDARGDRVIAHIPGLVYTLAFIPQGILLDDRHLPGLEGARGLGGTTVKATDVVRTSHFKLMDPQTGAIRDLPAPPLVDPFRRGLSTPAAGTVPPGQPISSAALTYVRAGNALWSQAHMTATGISTLARYDLVTGAVTSWYDGAVDGRGSLEVLGGDPSGRPIVQVSSSDLDHTTPAKRAGIHERVLLLTAPHQATVLNEGNVGAQGAAGNLSSLSVTEADRVWLASDDGQVWLYRRSAGMQLVAKVTTSTQGSPGIAISGPCF